MGTVVELAPHINMTVEECLAKSSRDFADASVVIVLAYDDEGRFMTMSSATTRGDAVFLLLDALDHARGHPVQRPT